MSSSASERRLLHMVVRPPWAGDALARALATRGADDVLLLVQEAAPVACAALALAPELDAALRGAGARVLAHDLAARGLAGAPLRDGVAALDDAAWVDLVASCDASVTWA
jgi:sulfur relay protein TusB/DsrH